MVLESINQGINIKDISLPEPSTSVEFDPRGLFTEEEWQAIRNPKQYDGDLRFFFEENGTSKIGSLLALATSKVLCTDLEQDEVNAQRYKKMREIIEKFVQRELLDPNTTSGINLDSLYGIKIIHPELDIKPLYGEDLEESILETARRNDVIDSFYGFFDHASNYRILFPEQYGTKIPKAVLDIGVEFVEKRKAEGAPLEELAGFAARMKIAAAKEIRFVGNDIKFGLGADELGSVAPTLPEQRRF